VFADRGVRNDPMFILKVEDKNGAVLERATPRPYEVLSENTAATMTSLLQSVMDHGTGFPARAAGFTAPAAGKTGTMDDYMDAWFVGYIPSLALGVWVGYDEKKTMGTGMTGARAALPIWTEIMLGATRGKPIEDFSMPAGSVSRTVCAESGMLATDQCPNTTSELYDEGSEPTEYCTTHPGRPLSPNEHVFGRPDSLGDEMHDIDREPGREEIHI
jgi:penicillin-binding protein 1A